MPPPNDPGTARLADVTGVLVAGGRAARMGGAPKGLMRLAGEPIAFRSLRLFRALFEELLVIANDPAPWEELGVRVIPDAIAGKGAPGGLHAALAAARTGWIFTAGCDMPFLSAGPIAWLAARRAGARAVIPRWRGRLEALHALWSRDCLAAVERRVQEGAPSFRELAAAVDARIVEEESWRTIDPDGRSFENVNTPEEAGRLGLALPPTSTG